MPDNAITLEETPESKATRAAIDRLVVISPEAAKEALRAIIGLQLRDSIGAWRNTATPGGPVWAPNSLMWAAYKRDVLGQNPVQVGVLTGDLRQSVASEMNEAALEGRVGTSVAYAPRFAAFRRFLPTIEKAAQDAQKAAERVLDQTIKAAGLESSGAGV